MLNNAQPSPYFGKVPTGKQHIVAGARKNTQHAGAREQRAIFLDGCFFLQQKTLKIVAWNSFSQTDS
jgi:hypothetical protein